VTRVDWGWVATLTLTLWPPAYCTLHAIRQAGHALTRTTRNRRQR
jgi:hypothetical protein